MKHTLTFIDSIKYSVKLSNVEEEQKPLITSQNASYSLILARHLPDVENVRMIEIYQNDKLSDTKYAFIC